jgi:hypothetical protein
MLKRVLIHQHPFFVAADAAKQRIIKQKRSTLRKMRHAFLFRGRWESSGNEPPIFVPNLYRNINDTEVKYNSDN